MRDDLFDIADEERSAIRYALEGGGKRIRGMLILAAYHAAGGRGDASGLAAAVEIVHAYSLVHDDLPCMDDDSMRRGRPTVHRKFGVPTATLAGAIMIPLAARVAYASASALALPRETRCAIVRSLARASGAGGMIGGQFSDLEAEGAGAELSRDELDGIHQAKTGTLIAASLEVGGLAANVEEPKLAALRSYGSRIGLAFQIMDDVLDQTSSTARMGKTTGRDVALGKSTYPALLGVDGAVNRAEGLISDACGELRAAGLLTDDLERIATFIVARTH